VLKFALIPAYKPVLDLPGFVQALLEEGFSGVIVVDDGGGDPFTDTFTVLRKMENVTVLTHATNQGKGAALKTGINHILNTYGDNAVLVTADADGQHLVKDIIAVLEASEATPKALTLGAREFSGNVPFRSRFGNSTTRIIFKHIHGILLRDTQTGLRGMTAENARAFLNIRSQGYNFELDMLIMAKDRQIPLLEVPIDTVYMENNQSSHFNPLFDSAKIYFSMFRFACAGLVATIIDNLVFIILFSSGLPIIASQIGSRTGASIVNYRMVHGMVFHSREKHRSAAPKYIATVIILGLVSYGLIVFSSKYLAIPVIVAKIAAETLIFVASFLIQKVLIFKEGAP